MGKPIEKIYNELPNARMTQEEVLLALETIYALTETTSQESLAMILGTTQATVASWIRRGSIPSDIIVWLVVRYNKHPEVIVGKRLRNPWPA